jgi:superfamily II DNA or RNA helicase
MLLARHRGQRTLVFVADNDTAYRIARAELVMPLTCDIGRREREDVLARFRAGQLRALVSAQVLNEGLDVPDADVGIVVGGRHGEREHIQRVGRLLRPGVGKRATVYELVVPQSGEARAAERRWGRLAPRSRPAA